MGLGAPVGSATAIAPALSSTPVGTKAGPGEIFDAEPFGARRQPSGGAPPRAANRRRRWWIAAVLGAAVVLIAGALFGLLAAGLFTPSHPTPSVLDQPLAQARATLDKVHMNLRVVGQPVTSIVVPAGAVVSQRPSAGVTQKQGSTVSVVVSGGKPDVTVPPLSNLTCAQAVPALAAAHLQAHCTPGQYDDSVPATVVVSWSYGSTPNPTKAPYGSIITIVPSLGHSPVPVPSIPTTYTYAQAVAALQAVGLQATQNPESNATVPPGNVIGTNPPSGAQAPYGSSVSVNVSTGPPTTQVPSVAGQSVAQATAALQAAGLSVSGVSGNPSQNVTGTTPAAGSTVQTGSSVQIDT